MKLAGRISALVNVLLVLTLVGVLTVVTVFWMFDKEGAHQSDQVFTVPQGAGIVQIANSLRDDGLIENDVLFRLLAYYEGKQSSIKFGEYEVPKSASMREILDILVDGKAIQLSVTFPEGWTSWAIIERLNEVTELEGEITEIPSEGSLAPNTYAFFRNSERADIVKQMQASQVEILDEAWENRMENHPVKSKEDLLILASLIEKETGTPDERPLVASVFVNRLRLGMKLQTDPTVIYGITLGKEKLGRGLRRSELDAPTPYNTYVIEGLPPTPIANPGKESILAAANPADTDYHYFVAKTTNPSDGHNFGVSLDDHNKNVQIYREAERAQREASE